MAAASASARWSSSVTATAWWAPGSARPNEVPEAIRKGVEDAKKNLIRVPLVGRHDPARGYAQLRRRERHAEAGLAGHRRHRRRRGARGRRGGRHPRPAQQDAWAATTRSTSCAPPWRRCAACARQTRSPARRGKTAEQLLGKRGAEAAAPPARVRRATGAPAFTGSGRWPWPLSASAEVRAGPARDVGPLDDRPQGGRAWHDPRAGAASAATRRSRSPTRRRTAGMLRRVAFLLQRRGAGRQRRAEKEDRRHEAPRSPAPPRARTSRRGASGADTARAVARPPDAARRARSRVPARHPGLVRGRPDAAPRPHPEAARLQEPLPGRVRRRSTSPR